MTSNGNFVAPVSPGIKTNSASLEKEIVVYSDNHYLPEIAVITVAICMITVVFFVLFPKKHSSE